MTPDDPPESILPSREDLAVAFCTHCGHVCEPLPPPKGKWRCPGCRRRCRIFRGSTSKRIGYLMKLLRGRNKDVMVMAQNGLVAFGEASRSWLLNELAVRPKIADRVAPVLGRVGGLVAVEALLKGMRQRQWKQRRHKWIWRWVLGAGAMYAFVFVHNGWCLGLFLLACMGAPSFVPRDWAAVQALEALRDPLAVGPIAVAHRQRELAVPTAHVLKTLLPLLRDEHAGEIKSIELAALDDLARSVDAELAVKAIGALICVGNARSLQALRSLAEERREGDMIGDAARQAIPELQRRMEWRKEKRTLLRAANAAPEEDYSRLLRPAPAGETDAKQLLRPAEGVQPDDPADG
jgi:hypothetical protein